METGQIGIGLDNLSRVNRIFAPPTPDQLASAMKDMVARMDAELLAMDEAQLAASLHWRWQDDASVLWNAYRFFQDIESHRRRCRQWEEAHHGISCVVERVRDKYLLPRFAAFLAELAMRTSQPAAEPSRLHDPAVLRAIIARNARRRMTTDDPAAPLVVTAQDIQDGMEILRQVKDESALAEYAQCKEAAPRMFCQELLDKCVAPELCELPPGTRAFQFEWTDNLERGEVFCWEKRPDGQWESNGGNVVPMPLFAKWFWLPETAGTEPRAEKQGGAR